MGGDDEVVDVVFMVGKKRMNVGLVNKLCTLRLGKDEIAEEEETDRGVEW